MSIDEDELEDLTKAFTGFGVDENLLISILGTWNPEQRQSFRKETSQIFENDEREFERWHDHHVLQLQHEFLRFKEAIVLWTMHPWERDARLFKEAIENGPRYDILVETACTRSSEELLGARRAYHSLYKRSIEEDIGIHIPTDEQKLLVALASSYRYEGPNVHEPTAKSEAKILQNAIKNVAKKNPLEDIQIIWILSTRSKLHIKSVYKHYKDITGNFLDEDLDCELVLKQAVQCLCMPEYYFSQLLYASLTATADEAAKNSATRVMVTRADVDMKRIKEEYLGKYGISIPEQIEEVTKGNYKEFMLTLVLKGD